MLLRTHTVNSLKTKKKKVVSIVILFFLNRLQLMILNFTSLFVVKDLNLLAKPCSPETTSCLLVKCKVQTLEDLHKDEKFD